MKFKFIKDESGNIAVKFSHDGQEVDFNYVRLINLLYSKKYTLEEPDFIGEISEYEQMKIKEMITQLNQAIIIDAILS